MPSDKSGVLTLSVGRGLVQVEGEANVGTFRFCVTRSTALDLAERLIEAANMLMDKEQN